MSIKTSCSAIKMPTLAEVIENITREAPVETRALHGGCIAAVSKLSFKNHPPLVVKEAESKNASLDLEGRMLQYLAAHSPLPVPRVFHSSPNLLVMAFLEGDSTFSRQAEEHAAELFTKLHRCTAENFGFDYDTLIGALHQPNPKTKSWLEFFTEHRIRHMATLAHEEGKLSAGLLKRLEAFCDRVDEWLDEPAQPALLHGDAWTTNMLSSGPKMTGFLDPAIYYGHPEIELAFTTMFGTFSDNGPFFTRYAELNPGWDTEGFFRVRRDLYNLYPLLVHVRLFGSGYAAGINTTLAKIGL